MYTALLLHCSFFMHWQLVGYCDIFAHFANIIWRWQTNGQWWLLIMKWVLITQPFASRLSVQRMELGSTSPSPHRRRQADSQQTRVEWDPTVCHHSSCRQFVFVDLADSFLSRHLWQQKKTWLHRLGWAASNNDRAKYAMNLRHRHSPWD